MFISGDDAGIDPAPPGPSGDQPTKKELGGMKKNIKKKLNIVTCIFL